MADDLKNQLRNDLAEFHARTSGPELEKLKTILHDYSLSWEQLSAKVSPDLLSFLLALLAPDYFGLVGADIPLEFSNEIAAARLLASRELTSLLRHPATAPELASRRGYDEARELARRALSKDSTIHFVEEPYFEEEDGKLKPRLRLALATERDAAPITLDCDGEDLLLLAAEILDAARRELERCLPFAEKEMLKLSFGEYVGPILQLNEQHLARIRELAEDLKILESEMMPELPE